MVSAAFSILGYDSVAHMCEEMYKPAVYAPRAMVGSVLISLPAGLLIILAFVFTIKDIPTIATQMCVALFVSLSSRQWLMPSAVVQFPPHLHPRTSARQQGGRCVPDGDNVDNLCGMSIQGITDAVPELINNRPLSRDLRDLGRPVRR